jgi:hypothetical protein
MHDNRAINPNPFIFSGQGEDCGVTLPSIESEEKSSL